MKTSEKLFALAKVIKRNRRFEICHPVHCIVGVGNRYNPETNSFERYTENPMMADTARKNFADKYGTTEQETVNLWLGYYDTKDYIGLWLGYYDTKDYIGSRSSTSSIKQAKQASLLLEVLARDYERRGE